MVKTVKSYIGSLIVACCLLVPTQLLAADASSLINTAGMQRMLSQQIAKAYFFLGERVRARKARKQMDEGIDLLRKNHQTLLDEINDPAIQKTLGFVGTTIDEFEQVARQSYGGDNVIRLLALSDNLLEVSQRVVEQLESSTNLKRVAIVNVSGRQRMLSQRIAKFYIAYQTGFRDQSVVSQLQQAVAQFEAAHTQLMSNKTNTPDITHGLERVDRLWKVVRGFFLDIEKGGLPVTVFSVSDKIMEHMDNVTFLYTRLNSNG